jgi:glycosyltransferase involved in cell wall biosynthesis
MKISIVIPAYNEEKRLPATLEKIKKALENVDCDSEIIVVDNESADRAAQIAVDSGAKVFREIEHNIARVRNTGAKNSSGDVLIFIDADTLVPETLFRKIAAAMSDEKCFGGAVAVEYEQFERKWMKYYLRGGELWQTVFNWKQGATQFCRKSVFQTIGGYDETIYMSEDVQFYRRLTKYAKQKGGYLFFVKEPRVLTSARRFDKMSFWKTLLLTHPLFFVLTSRKKRFWKDWYEKAVR